MRQADLSVSMDRSASEQASTGMTATADQNVMVRITHADADICEVRVSNLDAGRWARFPAVFVRWRPDRSPEDCGIDQLTG